MSKRRSKLQNIPDPADENKRVTWAEIEEKYPDMWAFVKNARHDGADIIDCEIICIVPFKEMPDVLIRLKNSGVEFERHRTTDTDFWLPPSN